jgi:hypothetical protein
MKPWLKAFVAGWLVSSSIDSINQDLMGKEKFLHVASALWLSAWITVPLALIGLVIAWKLIDEVKHGK